MKSLRPATLIFIMFACSPCLPAAPLYWDPGATTGTALGGTGNWDQEDAFWYNGSADIAWTNSNGDDAYFTGIFGTVTLTESISAGDVYFTNTTGSYTLTNATGAEVLTVAGVIDTGGGDHTIGAQIANSTTLNKKGGGRLHLPVDNSSTLTGNLAISQGDVSVENDNGAGLNNSVTVSNGAALVMNGGATGLTFHPNATINGSGITNSGALRNLSGVTTFNGQITLAGNNSEIFVDTGGSLVCATNVTLTDSGSNYNLLVGGSGTGNFRLGAINIGGTLTVESPAICYSYLIGVSPTAWKSTYVGPGATLYVESSNSLGTPPATLMTTNVILDGGTISSTGTYTNYTTDGITVTTNGGTLDCTSGTWTTCNLYSQSNGSLTLGGAGSFRPSGAAGGSTGAINLGTGTLVKSGGGDCNMGYGNASLVVYSNLVLNGGSLSFNYDQTSGQTSTLGALPSTLNPTNIYFNGGSMHVGHSTTIGATRGIYVASGGGTIEDVVSSGGTVTINSPISGPGNMNFPNGHTGTTSAVILAANNTYAGITTLGASCNVTVGNGGTTGTLGTGNTTDGSTLTFNLTGSYTYGGIISSSGALTKAASGIVTLTGANTYSGNTTISGGTLLINNTNGSGTGTGSVTVNSGGTLGGTGAISGPVTVASGGTLTPGTPTSPLGKLTINNSLSIAGNVTVSVNRTLQTNSVVAVTGTLDNTGTGKVTVTNLGAPLVANDRFYLFSQAVTGGGTLQITGASGVTWSNSLATDGSIVVVAPSPHPVITTVSLVGTNLVLKGTNGYNVGGYYLLTTTNILQPVSNWTRLVTSNFDSSGDFALTNSSTATNTQRFYLIQLQ